LISKLIKFFLGQRQNDCEQLQLLIPNPSKITPTPQSLKMADDPWQHIASWRRIRIHLATITKITIILLLVTPPSDLASSKQIPNRLGLRRTIQSYVISSFSIINDTFAHMTIDETTGRVYLGARNWVFQLSPGLNVEAKLQTGPRLDTPMCLNAASCDEEEHPRTLTNNVNKVLIVDPDGRTLIACGSLYQVKSNETIQTAFS
jgi:Sema domain